jgi:hypothetical protein
MAYVYKKHFTFSGIYSLKLTGTLLPVMICSGDKELDCMSEI